MSLDLHKTRISHSYDKNLRICGQNIGYIRDIKTVPLLAPPILKDSLSDDFEVLAGTYSLSSDASFLVA